MKKEYGPRIFLPAMIALCATLQDGFAEGRKPVVRVENITLPVVFQYQSPTQLLVDINTAKGNPDSPIELIRSCKQQFRPTPLLKGSLKMNPGKDIAVLKPDREAGTTKRNSKEIWENSESKAVYSPDMQGLVYEMPEYRVTPLLQRNHNLEQLAEKIRDGSFEIPRKFTPVFEKEFGHKVSLEILPRDSGNISFASLVRLRW